MNTKDLLNLFLAYQSQEESASISTGEIIGYTLCAFGIILILSFLLYGILASPFQYPYFTKDFDVSGKKMPDIMNILDAHMNKYGFIQFQRHYERVQRWKEECAKTVEKSRFKKRRERQFQEAIDDYHMFTFNLVRNQTRYRQRNYVKLPYTVTVTDSSQTFTYEQLKKRYEQLAEINFACSLAEYHSKNQRKLMTAELKEQIAMRDNFTCQKCGKYMPDYVGLHIDHIIPVSKGGKSIPSNLQVLCSVCNGSKGNKSAS